MPYKKHGPMPNEEVDRNNAICDLKRNNRKLKVKDIASQYGISHQMVSKILKRENLTRKRRKKRKAAHVKEGA